MSTRVASFPAFKTLRKFDLGFAAGVPKNQILELASLVFFERTTTEADSPMTAMLRFLRAVPEHTSQQDNDGQGVVP